MVWFVFLLCSGIWQCHEIRYCSQQCSITHLELGIWKLPCKYPFFPLELRRDNTKACKFFTVLKCYGSNMLCSVSNIVCAYCIENQSLTCFFLYWKWEVWFSHLRNSQMKGDWCLTQLSILGFEWTGCACSFVPCNWQTEI